LEGVAVMNITITKSEWLLIGIAVFSVGAVIGLGLA